nr:MAG: capsid protein [Cressdnaviricota sp.]
MHSNYCMSFFLEPFEKYSQFVRLASSLHVGQKKTARELGMSSTRQFPSRAHGQSRKGSRTTHRGPSHAKASSAAAAMAAAKSRSRSRSVARPRRGPASKLVHGGYDSQSVAIKHGRAIKLKPSFIKKVRAAATNPNYYNLKSVALYACASSQCAYFGSPSLYSYLEVNAMGANINNTAHSEYTVKYFVQSASLECMLVNATNAQAYVRVYECTPRNDIPASQRLPLQLLSDGFSSTQAGSADGPTDIDQTAFASPAFCCSYRISNVRVLKFNPGEQKTVTLKDLSPQLINMARWISDGNQLLYGIRRKSRFLLFQIWGQVATDSANLNHVGTTIDTVRVVYTMKYEYKFIADVTTTQFQGTCTDQAGTSATLTTLTTPQLVEEMTGAVASVVQD